MHAHTRRWAAAVRETEALVIVMPEYNRGYNAPLKNAIDFLYAEWEALPVAFEKTLVDGQVVADDAVTLELAAMFGELGRMARTGS